MIDCFGVGEFSDLLLSIAIALVLAVRQECRSALRVRRHLMMLQQSLFNDFREVSGMAEKYSEWAQQGVALHFVSSSPWQLYEPINEFLDASGFPGRSLSLKYFRFKDTTLLNLLKPGTETKPAQIKPILAAYPGRRFVLIGDSGEQGPEVYAHLLRRFPEQIEHIYIRNITGATRSDERFNTVFKEVDAEKWSLFEDPETLRLNLQ